MKTNKQIIQLARQAYNNYFKNEYREYVKKNEESGIILNQVKLQNDIKNIKLAEEKKLKTLEILRRKIEDEAKKKYQMSFTDKLYRYEIHEKMNVDKMNKQLKENTKNLIQMVDRMKQNQLSHQ